MRAYCLIVLALWAHWPSPAGLRSRRAIDRNGKPIGTDFSNIWQRAALGTEGRPADAYNPALQHAAEKRVFGRDVPFYGWHYPPFFLANCRAGGRCALYGWGLVIWALARHSPPTSPRSAPILPRRETLLVAAAFPAVFINVGHGHNGFLNHRTARAAHCSAPSPAVAGRRVDRAIGLQAAILGVLIPLALLADRRWITIGTRAPTVACPHRIEHGAIRRRHLAGLCRLHCFHSRCRTRTRRHRWQKIQSIFAATRMWGAGLPVAYAAQFSLAAGIAISSDVDMAQPCSVRTQATALAVGSLLATPYVLDYDLMVLAIAIAFFARHGLDHGFRAGEISLLALTWIMPLLTRSIAGAIALPLGFLVMVAFISSCCGAHSLITATSRHLHTQIAAA